MKNSQIVAQVIKKYVISIALIVVLSVCAFVFNPFDNSVFASERIASLEVQASLIDGETKEDLLYENLLLGDLDESNYDIGNVDVEITSTSKLVFSYKIDNLLSRRISFGVALQKHNMINMCFVVKIDGELFDFENDRQNLDAGESATVEISIFVDKVAKDACLDGIIVLDVSEVSEV